MNLNSKVMDNSSGKSFFILDQYDLELQRLRIGVLSLQWKLHLLSRRSYSQIYQLRAPKGATILPVNRWLLYTGQIKKKLKKFRNAHFARLCRGAKQSRFDCTCSYKWQQDVRGPLKCPLVPTLWKSVVFSEINKSPNSFLSKFCLNCVYKYNSRNMMSPEENGHLTLPSL